jgi:hypothetical protein
LAAKTGSLLTAQFNSEIVLLQATQFGNEN